jgi:glutamate/tyrosine decarboxylase-like PLP-dependent enzyme
VYAFRAPDLSRRARSLAVWATLAAYGRNGHRAIVERCLDNAAHLARCIDEADDLELLAPTPLNVVCFRYRPAGVPEAQLDELNLRIGRAVLRDGRVYVGTTRWAGAVAFRPAFVNGRRRPLTPISCSRRSASLGGRSHSTRSAAAPMLLRGECRSSLHPCGARSSPSSSVM